MPQVKTIFRPGDVVMCGKTPGFMKRIGDVVRAYRQDDGKEIVIVAPRGSHVFPGYVVHWYENDLRAAPVRFWQEVA